MVELSLIGFATAFAAGVISFLSPCVLPLVPGYVSFVAGSSLEELRDGAAPRLPALLLATTFVLGFSVVFVALRRERDRAWQPPAQLQGASSA